MRGALTFGGSPWARQAMWRDTDRTDALRMRATGLGVNVSVVAKTAGGPWVVRIGSTSRTLTFRGSEIHDVVEFGLERWAAGADDTGINWRGGADRLAHAHPGRGRQVWTLCKQTAVPENAVWPELRRCDDCWRALDGRVRVIAA